jgi:hypothetical protein
MIITYVKPDGAEEHFSTDDLSAVEAAAIEEALGDVPWRGIEDRLRGQDPTAMRAVVWVFQRRQNPSLKFADFDIPGWKRRVWCRIERADIDDFLTGLMREALGKSEDSSIDAMLPHLRRLAHDQADVDAALDALGKGHLVQGRQD